MTSPSIDEWPTDPDDLAGIASNPAQPREIRERALRELIPMIRRVARRVAARFAGLYVDELLGDASGEVWLALTGFQSGKSFEAWCYGVLRNHLIDRLRKEQRERMHRVNLAPKIEVSGLQQALERFLDQKTPFPEPDLATLRTWPLLGRLVVLALSGLWEKIPKEEWKAWVDEYRTSCVANFRRPSRRSNSRTAIPLPSGMGNFPKS
jgi:RNA polymerase sigma factor (sigma-70 family)